MLSGSLHPEPDDAFGSHQRKINKMKLLVLKTRLSSHTCSSSLLDPFLSSGVLLFIYFL